ncbi:hypothetical protein TNCV_661321 [Trichonephila clavipes]|nr:hypothetical protein TNCV_661321 [Trichonephila clavipes]
MCEYHNFDLLKKALKERQFPHDKEVPAADENWFHNRHRDCFPLGIHHTWSCGSPVVRVSDHGKHAMSSSPVPLKTRRVG